MVVSRPSRSEQAADLFAEVVAALYESNRDLVILLRKGFHACDLAGVGWELWKTWFSNELDGYRDPAVLPSYRKNLPGLLHWRPSSDTAAIAYWTLDAHRISDTTTTEDCFAGIQAVTSWAQTGLSNATGERREHQGRFASGSYAGRYTVEQYKTFPANVFQNLISMVESELLRFASSAVITLRYREAVQDVWEQYTRSADEAVRSLGLNEHFDHIREDIDSANPEKWRGAMWACRDVLNGLASRLWQDPASRYEPLANMEVTEFRPINRLLAYLHAKGVTGNVHAVLEVELEYFAAAMHALNDLDSKAHTSAPVSQEDALLAVIRTYLLLAQLARRTDLQPITGQSVRPSAPQGA